MSTCILSSQFRVLIVIVDSGILVENYPKQVVVIGIGCDLYQSKLTKLLSNSANLLATLPDENQIFEFLVYLIRQLYFWLLRFPNTDFYQSIKNAGLY